MKLIRIKYCPATNTRGFRWLADDGDNRMYGPYDYEDQDRHDGRLALARMFAEKFWRREPDRIEHKGTWKDDDFYGLVEI